MVNLLNFIRNAKLKKVVKISYATRSFPIVLAWDQAPLWGNERHFKKIGEQSEPTAGYDDIVFANQNCFQFLLWITVQEKLKTVFVQNFGWQPSKVNYGKSESGEFFNSTKQILLLRKIVFLFLLPICHSVRLQVCKLKQFKGVFPVNSSCKTYIISYFFVVKKRRTP